MEKLRGVIAAMLTPMNDDESLNLPELRRQTDRLLLAGIHGLFCLGTNGEFYALSRKEKLAVAETVIDQCAGRAPVFVGTGCVGTRETVELSREAERMGADALSIVCPWFAKCTGISQPSRIRCAFPSSSITFPPARASI